VAGPGINLKSWATGVDPVVPLAGIGGLALLIPAAEPLNVGAPPHAPDLVHALGIAGEVRAVRSRSGHLVTCPMDTAARARYRVAWTGLTTATRADMRAWLRDEVKEDLFSWTLEPDGPGLVGGELKVRFLTNTNQLFVGRGVFGVEEAEVEEIF
jgi:hypothetical protein